MAITAIEIIAPSSIAINTTITLTTTATVSSSDKPTADNTGLNVELGGSLPSLTNDSSTTLSSAGATYDAKKFTSNVTLTAANVTFTRCQFDGGLIIDTGGTNALVKNCKIVGGNYGIRCWSGASNVQIQNCEVDGSSSPGAIGSKGILGANFTASRCHIHHTGSDGIQTVGGDIVIDRCYIHDSGYGGYNASNPSDSDHTDGIQVFGGSNITVTYCHVVTRHGGNRSNGTATGFALQSQTNPYGTANSAVVFQSDESTGGEIDDFEISNCWLDGGQYTLRIEEKDGNEITNGIVNNNQFGRDYFFGSASTSTGTPSFSATGNVYEDNGDPVGGI